MSSNNNLIMFGRDRQAVEKLINLKVRDNSGGVLTNKVRDDLLKLRTFHMEFDIGIRNGKLPGVFARTFGMEVAPYVMLRDPRQNEFEIAVEKKNGKVYFTDGWAALKNFYDIEAGAWVTLIYANRNLFLFHAAKLTGEDFVYPICTPPIRMLLKHMTPGSSSQAQIPNAPTVFFLPTKFYHTMVKELTFDDVSSGALNLSWLGFCQSALPPEESELTVIDYLGYAWKCNFKFNHDKDVSCIISGQWLEICKARKFAEGGHLKLGVTGKGHNEVIYILPPSMLVLRTRMNAGYNVGVGGPMYQFEQFFWKN